MATILPPATGSSKRRWASPDGDLHTPRVTRTLPSRPRSDMPAGYGGSQYSWSVAPPAARSRLREGAARLRRADFSQVADVGSVWIMADIEKWFSLELLDSRAWDFDADPEAEHAAVADALPDLRTRFGVAQEHVAGSLAPVPANSPADDTWDDQIWFLRAVASSGYSKKKDDLEEAEQQLEALEGADNPGAHVAGLVFKDVHAYIKGVGLSDGLARRSSSPKSIGGLALAEIVWQARNQAEHYNDSRPLDDRVLDVFRVLVADDPEEYGVSAPPADDGALQSLLKQRSWAPHVVLQLGWTSRARVAAAVRQIRP